MFTCWKCNKELPDSTTTCPDCQSNVTQKVVDNMMTIGPGGGPTSQILPGVLVANRYEIKQEIGRGGMGIVYLAHDKIMEHDVALKVIPQELCMDPKAVTDLKRETSIALKLSHSHIMRLHNLDTWEGQAFVVMELVDGGTLAHLMADKGVFSLDDSLVYLKQIAEALDYSHASNPAVVHRDLKPLNILLNKDGEVKIADYGLARVLRDSASRISNQDSAGTLSYMAPEQVKGKGIGKAVDIYALAAIAYEMLSGTPPFYTGDLRWQIVHEDAGPIEGQPEHVNQALLCALSKEKEDRPETAGEFVARLAGEQGIGAIPKKKKRRVRREASGGKGQKQTGLVVGGLLLVVLLVAGGWFLSGKDSGSKNIFQSEPILMISSDPAGATVYVDGGEVGQTPTKVERLLYGTHEVRLTKEKYIGYEKKIFIQQGQPVTLNPSLVPEPFGDMKVTSNPSGATILVDGKELGITPSTLAHLDAGTRQIVLKKEEYDSWQGKAEIIPLQTGELHGDLVTVFGSLEIMSTPSDAEVFIDGEKIGTTPFNSTQVRKGKRQVELKLNGFDFWSSEVEVVLNSYAVLKADLATIYGSLTIISSPSGADIFLDGKKQGETPYTIDSVEKGQRQLGLNLSGYDNWQEKVKITVGKEHVVNADLVSSYGKVSISSEPPGAAVLIDGKEIGATPFVSNKISKGTRKIELSMATYRLINKSVTVSLESPVEERFQLQRKLGYYTDGMEFVKIPGGCFQMGNTYSSSEGVAHERPVHEVCVDGYFMGKYEVTNKQYRLYKSNHDSGSYSNGDKQPVVKVSWEDVQEYIKWLDWKTGKQYRLPAEAEWEYAARSGGKKVRFGTGKDTIGPDEAAFASDAEYKESYSRAGKSLSPYGTVPVGSFMPNALGLYDMAGNVEEWCADGYDSYHNSSKDNPLASFREDYPYRIVRGGGIHSGPSSVRAASRGTQYPARRDRYRGFRLVFSEGNR